MLVYKGYQWTFLDLVLSAIIVCLFISLGVTVFMKVGLSLASVAGSLWGFGSLIFIFLYPFPIYGSSIEGLKLLKEGAPRTKAEVELVKGRSNYSNMPVKTIKGFFLFFFFSGGLALLGIFTNT